MTFIDEKTKYADFFNTDEMGFYTNVEDLLNQMNSLYGKIDKINKISKNGKRKYFSIFNNEIISEYILFKTFNIKNKFRYVWD
jgi:hypothetical protein